MIKQNPWILVCNASPSSSEGTHWFTLFKDGSEQMELLDSLGCSPAIYDLQLFMQNQGVSKCVYNSLRIQDVRSSVCGHYCVYFTHQKCLGNSIDNIVERFSVDNHTVNDLYVYDFYNSFIKYC